MRSRSRCGRPRRAGCGRRPPACPRRRTAAHALDPAGGELRLRRLSRRRTAIQPQGEPVSIRWCQPLARAEAPSSLSVRPLFSSSRTWRASTSPSAATAHQRGPGRLAHQETAVAWSGSTVDLIGNRDRGLDAGEPCCQSVARDADVVGAALRLRAARGISSRPRSYRLRQAAIRRIAGSSPGVVAANRVQEQQGEREAAARPVRRKSRLFIGGSQWKRRPAGARRSIGLPDRIARSVWCWHDRRGREDPGARSVAATIATSPTRAWPGSLSVPSPPAVERVRAKKIPTRSAFSRAVGRSWRSLVSGKRVGAEFSAHVADGASLLQQTRRFGASGSDASRYGDPGGWRVQAPTSVQWIVRRDLTGQRSSIGSCQGARSRGRAVSRSGWRGCRRAGVRPARPPCSARR